MLLIEALLNVPADDMSAKYALEVVVDGGCYIASIVDATSEPLYYAEGGSLTEALTNLNALIHKHQ